MIEIRGDQCRAHDEVPEVYSLASTGDVLWAVISGRRLRAYIDGQWRQYEGSVTARIPKVVPSCECYRKGTTVYFPEQDVIKGIPFVRIGQMRLASDDDGSLWLLYRVRNSYNVVRFAGTHLECWDDDVLRRVEFAWVVGLVGLGTSPGGTVWAAADGVILEFDGEAWTGLEGPPQAEALYTRGGGEAWVTAPDGVWQYAGEGWVRRHSQRPLGAALHPEGGLLVAIEEGEVIHLRGDGETTPLGAPHPLRTAAWLAVDEGGTVWSASEEGVYRLVQPATSVTETGFGAVKEGSRHGQ